MGPSYDLFHWYGWKNFLRDWRFRDAWHETVTQRSRVWQMSQVLKAAVDWNDEYKRINNLCGGDPYWVPWAKEILERRP